MNDLSGLSWDEVPPSNGHNNRNGSQYASMKPQVPFLPRGPSPLSGRCTPGTGNAPAPKPQDSFAALLAPNGGKKTTGLTLAEKQKQLQEEKLRQAHHQDPFRTNDSTFWEGFGSGRSTPAQISQSTTRSQSTRPLEDVDDILAAFNSAEPVDASSHYPPPQNGSSDYSSRAQSTHGSIATSQSRTQSQAPYGQSLLAEVDDDPFGLAEFSQKQQEQPSRGRISVTQNEEVDILGILGKPVKEVSRHRQPERRRPAATSPDILSDEDNIRARGSDTAHPQAKAVADLVDMGFPEDKARQALEHTETGLDTQAAISWILTQAHEEAKSKSKTKEFAGDDRVPAQNGRQRRPQGFENDTDDESPALSRQPSRPDRNDSRSPMSGDGDVAKYASQISGTIFKSATTLWKSGQKKAQKVIAEYQQKESTGQSSQPKWMHEAELRAQEDNSSRGAGRHKPDVTDEALMLEPGRAPPPSRTETRRRFEDDDVFPLRPSRQDRFEEAPRQVPSRPISRSVEKLSRRVIEEESAQAYISPARRKPATPVPQPPSPKPREEDSTLDIFSDTPAPISRPTASSQPVTDRGVSRTSTPISVRPKGEARNTPLASSTALSTSTKQRQLGSEAFKRGDYGEATSCYTAALSPLPPTHPITIVLHCNRALTHLKTGDAKAAIVDADAALKLIGPARGEDETISLGTDEMAKPMKEFFGKALMRKAEAYEHLEKWNEAAMVWREAVQTGVGGLVSIASRNRCEKATGGSSTSAAPSAPATRPAHKKAPAPRPASRKPTSGQGSSEAVVRLRAANAAAAQASDEAFALTDAVTARIDAWKGGKEGNLRALLSSLDNVLWTEANWTKIGLSDLVLPNRVKIIYMKAIARVHPDKLAQDVTIEQKMISASVFATLNEAWDKFKRDNNM